MNRLDFNEFKETVVAKIREFLPETFANAEVLLNVVTKNNDMKLTGLTIRTSECNIAPTIYLESFYQNYEDGAAIEEVLMKIAEVRTEHDVKENFDVEFVTDYSICKEKILPKLINRDMNECLLSSRPYKEVADLAVIYCIMLGNTNDGSMSIGITNQILDKWNITVDELHDAAISNIAKVDPCTFKSMSEVMIEMMLPKMVADCGDEEQARELLEQMIPEEEKMYVLSTASKLNGAVALLDKDFVNDIKNKFDDFYILPSSIHEVLIVPKCDDMNVSALKEMVIEVNSTQVSIEDRLSDNVYTFVDGTLVIAE